MQLEVHTLGYRSPYLPIFLDYYTPLADKVVISLIEPLPGELELCSQYFNVEATEAPCKRLALQDQTDYRNACVRNAEADWTIYADLDELMYHPDLRAYLSAQPPERKLLYTQPFDAYGNFYPQTWDELMTGEVGWREGPRLYAKPCIFRPDLPTTITRGGHQVFPMLPVPASIVSDVALLHLKRMGNWAQRLAAAQAVASNQADYTDLSGMRNASARLFELLGTRLENRPSKVKGKMTFEQVCDLLYGEPAPIEHGGWTDEWHGRHMYDPSFAAHLGHLLRYRKCGKILDLGCGNGAYVGAFKAMGFHTRGFDGCDYHLRHPQHYTQSCYVRDLAVPQELGKWDAVVSLEVGEHIPAEYSDVFLDNVCNHATKCIALTWAKPNQPGHGHVNCLPRNEVIRRVHQRGWKLEKFAVERLRGQATLPWLGNNIMFFNKKG